MFRWELPKWTSDHLSLTADVPLNGCGETSFAMRPDAQVIGKAVEIDGTPARNVLLKLVTTGDISETVETRTNQDGQFHFHGVLKGNYSLGVNPEPLDDPSEKVPYAPTLYPGVRDEKRASVIRVQEFGTVRLENTFKLPARARPRTIQVSVSLDNGKPLNGASVSCTPAGRSYWRKDLTNAQGVIRFSAMDRVEYIVDADISSDHPLANQGYNRSQWVRVGPGTGVTEVRIVFTKVENRQ